MKKIFLKRTKNHVLLINKSVLYPEPEETVAAHATSAPPAPGPCPHSPTFQQSWFPWTAAPNRSQLLFTDKSAESVSAVPLPVIFLKNRAAGGKRNL